jgi:DNA-binding MarR family transcriptional regulator
MVDSAHTTPCNCLAVRQAARHITQFYDQYLAPTGLRTTQYSILANLERIGASTINLLASELVIDRTTLGRTMLPLEREGLIAIGAGASDRRERQLRLTAKGARRLSAARELWKEAQRDFETAFGGERALRLRSELYAVVSSKLPHKPARNAGRRPPGRVRKGH